MDPITGLGVSLAAKASDGAIDVGKNQAESFLGKVFGPPAEAIGEWLALKPRERLFKNMIKAVLRADKMLKDAGVEPRRVPLKLIHPLLENASLEEDDDLSDRWAALLANAADTDFDGEVQVTFVAILKELTHREAKLLDLIYEEIRPDREQPGWVITFNRRYSFGKIKRLYAKAGLFRVPQFASGSSAAEAKIHQAAIDYDNELVKYSVDVLVRTMVMSLRTVPAPVKLRVSEPNVDGPIEINQEIAIDTVDVYEVTNLGLAFIKACRAPPKSSRTPPVVVSEPRP